MEGPDYGAGSRCRHVRLWHKADILLFAFDVRFRGQSGHSKTGSQLSTRAIMLVGFAGVGFVAYRRVRGAWHLFSKGIRRPI
jgi:hypothetical protein